MLKSLLASILLIGLTIGMTPVSVAQEQPTPDKPRISKPAEPASKPKTSPNSASKPGVQPSSKGTKSSTPPAGAVELSDEPQVLESVGLKFFPPAGAKVIQDTAGREARLTIVPVDESWQINVTSPRTSNPDLTVTTACDELIAKLMERVGQVDKDTQEIKTLGKVLSRSDKLVLDTDRPELLGEQFVVSLPRGKGDSETIRGYTLVKIAADRFVNFELITTADKYQAAGPVYQIVVRTAKFEDAERTVAARAAAIAAGRSVFGGLSDEALREIMKQRNGRFERLYRPAVGGARMDESEVAYRRTTTWFGKRGELDPSRPAKDFTAAEKEEGYLLRTDARYVNGAQVVDVSGTFFIRPDRSMEAWVVRQAIREAGKKDTVGISTEKGAREGNIISVVTEVTGQADESVKTQVSGDGYLSRFESLLLPQILIRSKVPTEFGFYVYQSEAGKVQLRRELLEQPPERPGLWKLTTRLSEDRKPMVSLFNDQGDLIRTELSDGSIWEPIDAKALVRLWRDKNLPLD
ncbi:MAG: hypothetical protein IT432_00945 [Phycisphaerales bacterium]|nr:hypothetical protein [Phycisphaerales bacterium]